MRTTKTFGRTDALAALVLLLLLPVGASARQRFDRGWYRVNSKELLVRNQAKQLPLATLTNAREPGRNYQYGDPGGADRFYITFWQPGLNYAWGYADGKDFKDCGWVGVRSRVRREVKDNLVRITENPPPPPGKCAKHRAIGASAFAAPLLGGSRRYVNHRPRGDGSGAKVMAASTTVFGNYTRDPRGGRSFTTLRSLGKDAYVRWRYFTRDRRYVMVGLGRRPKGKRRKLHPGNWGFVRCADIRPEPDPKDKADTLRFNATCVR